MPQLWSWSLIQRADPSRSYHMTVPLQRTVNQIIRKGPVKERRRRKVGPMSGRPQLKGVVLQVMIRKTKKPNSAQRKCCRVQLSTGKEVIAYIPGEGHTLQEHNVAWGRMQDLPGVNVQVIRGNRTVDTHRSEGTHTNLLFGLFHDLVSMQLLSFRLSRPQTGSVCWECGRDTHNMPAFLWE